MTKIARGVPDAEVPALKALWESEGYSVSVKDNGDGTSDVTATAAAGAAATRRRGRQPTSAGR